MIVRLLTILGAIAAVLWLAGLAVILMVMWTAPGGAS